MADVQMAVATYVLLVSVGVLFMISANAPLAVRLSASILSTWMLIGVQQTRRQVFKAERLLVR